MLHFKVMLSPHPWCKKGARGVMVVADGSKGREDQFGIRLCGFVLAYRDAPKQRDFVTVNVYDAV
jgi:hypothetical protein